MKYNNYGKQQRGNQRRYSSSRRSNAGGQSYVWRLVWYNFNVKNGANQYRSFRSKAQALIFRDKIISNPNNHIFWDV